MSRFKSIFRSRMTWAIVGFALAGYLAFLVVILGIVVVAPRNLVELRLNDDGDLYHSNAVLTSDDEINAYLVGLFEKARRATRGGQPDQVKTLVVITAPDLLPFKHVWRVMHASKQAGFTRWDLRGMREQEPPDAPPLPNVEETAPSDPATPSEMDLELPDHVTVHLRAAMDGINDGSLSFMVVSTAEGETAIQDYDTLRRYLRLRQGPTVQNRQVRIIADSELMYGQLLNAVRECKKAGFTRVRYLPPPGWTPPDPK